MKIYHLSPLFFEGLKRKLFLFVTPLMVLAAGAGAMIYFANPANQQFNATPFILVFIAAVLVYSIWNAWRQQYKLWRSYQIVLSESAITREQMGFSPITITRAEIAGIVELPDQGLSICATDHSRQIIIPSTLEGFAEVRARLSNWHSLEAPPPQKNLWPGWLAPMAGLGSIAAFLVVFISTSKYLVIVVGSLYLIMLVASAIMMWRSKLVDRSARRRLWMVIFPALAIAARVMLTAAEP